MAGEPAPQTRPASLLVLGQCSAINGKSPKAEDDAQARFSNSTHTPSRSRPASASSGAGRATLRTAVGDLGPLRTSDLLAALALPVAFPLRAVVADDRSRRP